MVKLAVAFLWALLSMAAGAAGCMAAERCREQENTDQAAVERPVQMLSAERSAADLLVRLKAIPAKDRVLTALAALLVCAAALRLFGAEVPPLTCGRLLMTAVLLHWAMAVDRKTHRIPNGLVLVMLGAGALPLAAEFVWMPGNFRGQLLSSAIGLAGFLVVFYLMSRMTRGGLGMGDVKLIAAEGWLVGFVVTLWATVFSLMLCSIGAVFLILFKKRNSSDQIPFGPFLFYGYILSLLICNL